MATSSTTRALGKPSAEQAKTDRIGNSTAKTDKETATQRKHPTKQGEANGIDDLIAEAGAEEPKDTEDEKGNLSMLLGKEVGMGNVTEFGTAARSEAVAHATQSPEGFETTKGVTEPLTPLHSMVYGLVETKGKLAIWAAGPRLGGHPVGMTSIVKGINIILFIAIGFVLARGEGTRPTRHQERGNNSCEDFVTLAGTTVAIVSMMTLIKMDHMVHGGVWSIEARPWTGAGRPREMYRIRRARWLNTGVEDQVLISIATPPPKPGDNESGCLNVEGIEAPMRTPIKGTTYLIEAAVTFRRITWSSSGSSGGDANPVTSRFVVLMEGRPTFCKMCRSHFRPPLRMIFKAAARIPAPVGLSRLLATIVIVVSITCTAISGVKCRHTIFKIQSHLHVEIME